MSRNPHRVRRDRWGRDLDLGDMANESWFWRLVLPWGDHYTVVVLVILAIFAVTAVRDGTWGLVAFDVVMFVVIAYVNHVRLRRRRIMREVGYLFNAWEQIDRIDGQEGP